MKNLLVVVIVLVALVGGTLLGKFIGYRMATQDLSQEIADQKAQIDKLANEKKAVIQDFGKKFNELVSKVDGAQKELATLKALVRTKDEQLEEFQAARSRAERAAKAPTLQPVEAKPKPPDKNPKAGLLANAIKMQMAQIYQKRISKLNEKLPLSDYQKGEMDKLLNKQIDRIVEMSTKLLSGEITMDDITKNDDYKQDLFDDGLKDLLTSEQQDTYNTIKDEDNKEQASQAAKLYVNGTMGFKGINEFVTLNDDQKQQIQGMLEEKFQSQKSTNPMQSRGSATPFDDKEFANKVRGVLTQDQQPKFDEYLKSQEEFKKMINGILPGTQPSAPK